MSVWETEPSLRESEAGAAFADVWRDLPKVVFSRSRRKLVGNARQATASVADEVAAALNATEKDVSIGGAGLAAAAIGLDLVDELRMFRYPVVLGAGTPFLPPVTEELPLRLIETSTFGSRVMRTVPARPRRTSITR
jgi:dihydrofolate reductase